MSCCRQFTEIDVASGYWGTEGKYVNCDAEGSGWDEVKEYQQVYVPVSKEKVHPLRRMSVDVGASLQASNARLFGRTELFWIHDMGICGQNLMAQQGSVRTGLAPAIRRGLQTQGKLFRSPRRARELHRQQHTRRDISAQSPLCTRHSYRRVAPCDVRRCVVKMFHSSSRQELLHCSPDSRIRVRP